MASWPPLLRADTCAAMLNFEIADHEIYDGLELQWFDDVAHGRGMLAFLGRRDSHLFDYYAQQGLRLHPADYQIGAGTSAWDETDIADALLEVTDDGVHAAAQFTDVDCRCWPTPTTNGKPTNDAAYPKPPWSCCTPTGILVKSRRSTAANRHRGSSKPTTPRGSA